ncbi:MAG: hypothetical protein II743_05545, partial [Lachnospiraceae bacterium]|nr:hypothetical protein [Lachnospiraceae bacterium]
MRTKTLFVGFRGKNNASATLVKALSDQGRGRGYMKWIFFDLGATLVDESDVYESRCGFAVRQLNIDLAEFMNKVYEEA